jgi:CheY-like chemotaxis protein
VPPETVWLDADPMRLAQVLANLLNNAAKYTDRGGHLELWTTRDRDRIAIHVRDDGIGLDAASLSRVFEMFSQVASSIERSEGGLGIGLALVRGLVAMHGGRVEARSEGTGRGSEFVVHLPLPPSEPSTVAPAAAAEGEGGRERRRIVVADDNVDAAESLALLLRLDGHEVEVVHDGEQAVAAVERLRPDAALLDIGMPKLNGYEAAQRIRARGGDDSPMLVAVTGWGQREDRQLASRAGFDHHLTKPVDFERLAGLLAQCGAPLPAALLSPAAATLSAAS